MTFPITSLENCENLRLRGQRFPEDGVLEIQISPPQHYIIKITLLLKEESQMAITADVMNSLVSVTQFNKGQASKIFDRLRTERQLIVLKNNAPSAVILSPKEYERLSDIEEDYRLLMLAQERIAGGSLEHTVPLHDAMADLGISEAEIKEAEELDIE